MTTSSRASPAGSTASASSASRRAGWRSTTRASDRDHRTTPHASASASTSAPPSAASPSPRTSTSASSSAASARSRRRWRCRCSGAPHPRTSASRSTSAGRSSRPPTPARRAGSRSARRSARSAPARSTPRSRAGSSARSRRSRSGRSTSSARSARATTTSLAVACRPFDADRDGFVMGEGAALLVLEEAVTARARGAEPYAVILGYGASSDAHHMVQPRPDGIEAARAVTIALADAGTDAGRDRLRERPRLLDPDRRHRRGTGARARARSARTASVPVSGTKALYGHPLGATGAIEAALCALVLRDGWAPASTNLVEPDSDVAALLPGLIRDEGPAGHLRSRPVDVVRLRGPQRRARPRDRSVSRRASAIRGTAALGHAVLDAP